MGYPDVGCWLMVDGGMAGVAGRVWTRQKDLNGGGMRSNLYADELME